MVIGYSRVPEPPASMIPLRELFVIKFSLKIFYKTVIIAINAILQAALVSRFRKLELAAGRF